MAAEKLKIVSPRGELHWVNISGQGKENYNQDGYDYTASLRVKIGSPEDVELKKQIDDYYDTHKNPKLDTRSLGYRDVLKDTGEVEVDEKGKEKKIYEATGFRDYVFKTKTTFTDAKTGETVTKKVGVFNSKAQKVSLGNKKVGNGTIGAISGQAAYYTDGKKEDGVSLFLNNIQIFKFEEYQDNGGFGEDASDEGGWTGNEGDSFEGEPETAPETDAPAKPAAKPRL